MIRQSMRKKAMVNLRQLSKKELVGLLVKLGRDEFFIHVKEPSKEWLLNELREEMRKKNVKNKDIAKMLSDLPKLTLYK